MMNKRKIDKEIQYSLFSSEPSTSLIEVNFGKLEVFRRCPLEFKLKYLDKKKEIFQPKGENILIGRFFHTVIRDFLKIDSQSRSEERLFFLLDDLKEKWVQKNFLFNDKDLWHNKTLEAINIFKNNFPWKIKTIALEYHFKTKVDDLVFTGRIDYLGEENVIKIFEFKTDEFEVPLNETDSEKYLQLIFYYYGIKNFFRENISHLAYYFFSTGRLESIKISEDLLRTGLLRIKDIVQELKSIKDYKPKVNPLCQSCGYNKYCKAYKNRGGG